MFSPKDYACVCHGCGTLHDIRAEFLSTGSSIQFKDPAKAERLWVLPVHGCPACMATPTDPARPDEHPIRRAFLRGMTAEARARSVEQFATWLPVLEARLAASR